MKISFDEPICVQLRAAYRAGLTIPEIIRREPALAGKSPSDIMFLFMSAFDVGLADVSCIDGWWPPELEGEVSDDNLDLFVRRAVEARRPTWERLK